MQQKPNIVYILADDMGYGDLSCLNEDSKIKTHHMDRLASQGMTFTDAHASSSVCTPSRYSILTGRYNWRSRLKRRVFEGYEPHLIESGRLTVGALLQDHGYHTACIGKWHLGMDWTYDEKVGLPNGWKYDPDADGIDYAQPIQNGPTAFGFEHFFGISSSLDIAPYVYIENDHVTAAPSRLTENDDRFGHWRKGPTGPDFEHKEVLPVLTMRAVDYIDSRASEGQPFFLYFPLPAPHMPILPTPEFLGKSRTNAYGDFVLMVDDVVGQVMAALERNGLADNTILIVTSDNGCSPRADFEGLAKLGHHPSYHFRGYKADIYEGGHRIPLLMRWPERIRASTRCDETVCLVDLMATCAELIGAKLPDSAGEDSVSNLPLWLGKSHDSPVREATVHHSIHGAFSIRNGRWKLEMCPGSGGWSHPRPGEECEGLPPIQLYDLERDIRERVNVYEDHPDVVSELRNLLVRYIRDGRSTPGQQQPNTGPRHWDELDWVAEAEL